MATTWFYEESPHLNPVFPFPNHVPIRPILFIYIYFYPYLEKKRKKLQGTKNMCIIDKKICNFMHFGLRCDFILKLPSPFGQIYNDPLPTVWILFALKPKGFSRL